MNKFVRGRRNIGRLAKILEIAAKHGFGYFIDKYGLSKYLPRSERRKKFPKAPAENFAKRLCNLLQELGPTFVKVGQLISVRPDLAPPEVIFELEKLQDEVAPFDFNVVQEVIRDELGKEIDEVFEEFDPYPIASASIGQVHLATLKEGGRVAVKVQRPGAQEMIEADLDLLFTLARMVKSRIKFVDIEGVVEEFSASLHRELDYRIEGKHVDRFRFNFKDDPLIKIPLVYWKYSSKRVLTLEYIEGSKLSDLATPEALGIDTFALAKHGAQAFMKQVLEHGFFHGDLHPANLLITPDGKIAYLDFGIVGQVTEKDRETITFMLMGIIRRDIEEIVERAKELGVNIPLEKIPVMREEFKDILDRYYGKKLKDLKIDIIGREFLGLIYRHHLRIPKDFALLAKALVTIEGTAKQIYPEFNVLEVAKPYVYDLIKREYSTSMAIEDIYEELKNYAFYLKESPRLLYEFLKKVDAGELKLKQENPEQIEFTKKLSKASVLLSVSLLAAAIIIGFALLIINYPGKTAIFTWLALSLVFLLVFLLIATR